jgi:diguanylate cyclase (GGDEF)-like protein
MVTVISRFRVRNGFEDQVRAAFLARPRLVENEKGFCGLEVLTDAADGSVFLLITRWTMESAFRAWHASEAHHHSHEFIPQGLKLDASFTQIVVGNRVEDPQGVDNLSDAIEGQTVALSRWLLNSDTVFALLLGADGTIRLRNRAANRIFPGDPASGMQMKICDSMVCSDAESFARRLSGPAGPSDGPFRLNLSDGQSDPLTVEASLVDCAGGFLLLGAAEERHALRLQAERQVLANQLATMARELARKNKELEAANHAIERIARTDVLTGLSNRRTLDEVLSREIARANRQHQPLTLILADVDHFKAINDSYGHVAGDHVLSALGRIFGSQVRPYDVAARFGGEEFVLVFPGTECHEGVAIAERLRRQVEAIQIPNVPERVTISCGVATLAENDTAEAFLARADTALYRAKDGGRNRVEADVVGSLQS